VAKGKYMEAPISPVATATKSDVQAFWNKASCGEEAYAQGDSDAEKWARQAAERYRLEPYLAKFARFEEGAGKDVLEIGVGMGADFQEWGKAKPRTLYGVDLTPRGVDHTRARMAAAGLPCTLAVGDAENLPVADAAFDIVYAWGVLHHSPDTPKAFREVARVLRPGGVARIMVYHTWSLTGLMLWVRYALMKGKPFTRMRTIYSTYLESPGTKAYTVAEGRKLCLQAGLVPVSVRIQLNHGDLLQGKVGQRHQGRLLSVAQALWPRRLLKLVMPFLGLYLLIEAQKPVA
jgi:SAM-dependent methyltransferase